MDGAYELTEAGGALSPDLVRLTAENARLRLRLREAGLDGDNDDERDASPNGDPSESAESAGETQARLLVAELLALNAKLRMADAFTQRLLAASEDCIKLVDFDGVILSINAGGLRVLEAGGGPDVVGKSWLKIWTGEEVVMAREALDTARDGGSGRFQGRFTDPQGGVRWWDVIVTAVAGPSGATESLLVVSRDITEQREAQAYRNVMHDELRHRVKNMLAMVQAIVAQTLRTAPTPAAARAVVDQRVVALSRAHDLLSMEGGRGAMLAQVAAEAMRPFDDGAGRIRIEGAALCLSAEPAVAFALMLNEMGVNATKYGALSTGAGRVEIAWRVEAGTLHFTWRESGGPMVTPPTRTGFGSVLIERNLAHQLDAQIKLDYAPTGVTLTLAAPIPSPPGPLLTQAPSGRGVWGA